MRSRNRTITRQNSYALLPSPGLCSIQGRVRKFDSLFRAKSFECAAAPAKWCPAPGTSLPYPNAVSEIERFRCHGLQNSLAECRRTGRVRRTGHDQEFFSSPTNQNVGLAHDLRKTFRHPLQKTIARGMAMKIVHLLKEIDVHHDEDQIAVIQLANVAAAGSRIISQHLLNFCPKNLFQIPPVPHASQPVSEGDFLKFKILALQFLTVPPQ